MIKRYFQEIYFSSIFFFFLSFWIPGHLCLSVSIINLFLISILKIDFHSFSIKNKRNYISLIIILIYFISLISGVWGGINPIYFQKVAMKSSLLVLPLAFLFLPSLKIYYINKLKISLLFLFYFTSLISIIFFILNFKESIDLLVYGKPIWLPFKHHIHYGVFILFLFLWVIIDIIRKVRSRIKLTKFEWLNLLYFVMYIHFISVRSAWLSFYLIIFSIWLYFLKNNQRKIFYIIKTSIVFSLSLILIFQIPTIKAKINYTKWSLSQSTNDYSDIKRGNSIRQGIELIKINPILGFGEGGASEALREIQNVPEISNVVLPHNQFINSWVSQGIFGFILMIFLFLYLLHEGIKSNNYFLILFEMVLLVVFMVEPFLETQLGLALFLLPLLFIEKNSNYFKF